MSRNYNVGLYLRVSKDKVLEVLKEKFNEDISLKLLMDNIESIKVIDKNNIEIIDKK